MKSDIRFDQTRQLLLYLTLILALLFLIAAGAPTLY